MLASILDNQYRLLEETSLASPSESSGTEDSLYDVENGDFTNRQIVRIAKRALEDLEKIYDKKKQRLQSLLFSNRISLATEAIFLAFSSFIYLSGLYLKWNRGSYFNDECTYIAVGGAFFLQMLLVTIISQATLAIKNGRRVEKRLKQIENQCQSLRTFLKQEFIQDFILDSRIMNLEKVFQHPKFPTYLSKIKMLERLEDEKDYLELCHNYLAVGKVKDEINQTEVELKELETEFGSQENFDEKESIEQMVVVTRKQSKPMKVS